MFKKSSSNRIDRNDIGEEFTGFAWMREKKIHQKIGIRGLFLKTKFLMGLRLLDNLFIFLIDTHYQISRYRSPMDKRERGVPIQR